MNHPIKCRNCKEFRTEFNYCDLNDLKCDKCYLKQFEREKAVKEELTWPDYDTERDRELEQPDAGPTYSEDHLIPNYL